jgi:hypothetical protein
MHVGVVTPSRKLRTLCHPRNAQPPALEILHRRAEAAGGWMFTTPLEYELRQTVLKGISDVSVTFTAPSTRSLSRVTSCPLTFARSNASTADTRSQRSMAVEPVDVGTRPLSLLSGRRVVPLLVWERLPTRLVEAALQPRPTPPTHSPPMLSMRTSRDLADTSVVPRMAPSLER